MISRKYIVHVIGTGFVGALVILASTCEPLNYSQLTQFVHGRFDPSCYIKSYSIEPPELPSTYTTTSSIPIATRNSGTSIGTTTTL